MAETVPQRASEPTVDLLTKEWQTLSELCVGLSEEEWTRPTDCPGWTVKDQISHIIGTELMLSGQEPPKHIGQMQPAGSREQTQPPGPPRLIGLAEPDSKAGDAASGGTGIKANLETGTGGAGGTFSHVKNPIGEVNELWVEARRISPPRQVLEEFRQVTTERLTALRSMDEESFAQVGWTPVGQAPYVEFMAIRVFDCWVHEQDIRRAVTRPGNLTGEIAGHSRERIKLALPYVVGKKAQSPDGSVVAFHISGSDQEIFAIEVHGRRAALTDHLPYNPTSEMDSATAYLEMSFETLACLGCGRWDPAASLQQGRVSITGNVELGTRVLENLNFMI
ncbi:MAG: maleylpyruvate isomerase family mycothiol-dependent enzyme [Acidimicrobiales bacterium]